MTQRNLTPPERKLCIERILFEEEYEKYVKYKKLNISRTIEELRKSIPGHIRLKTTTFQKHRTAALKKLKRENPSFNNPNLPPSEFGDGLVMIRKMDLTDLDFYNFVHKQPSHLNYYYTNIFPDPVVVTDFLRRLQNGITNIGWWVIFCPQTGQKIGLIGCHVEVDNEPANISVALLIAEEAKRNGYGFQASKILYTYIKKYRHLFRVKITDDTKITISTHPHNYAILRIAEKVRILRTPQHDKKSLRVIPTGPVYRVPRIRWNQSFSNNLDFSHDEKIYKWGYQVFGVKVNVLPANFHPHFAHRSPLPNRGNPNQMRMIPFFPPPPNVAVNNGLAVSVFGLGSGGRPIPFNNVQPPPPPSPPATNPNPESVEEVGGLESDFEREMEGEMEEIGEEEEMEDWNSIGNISNQYQNAFRYDDIELDGGSGLME